jgi:hypothetical protein
MTDRYSSRRAALARQAFYSTRAQPRSLGNDQRPERAAAMTASTGAWGRAAESSGEPPSAGTAREPSADVTLLEVHPRVAR